MRIDWWTLALQTVNVLILAWLLARFLFRPVRAIIAERQAEAGKLLADAAASRAHAQADAAAIQHRLQDLSGEAERMLAKARTEAAAERSRLMQEAADAASRTHDEAGVAIENDRITMERTLRERAGDLAVVIARRLLQRLPAKAATACLLEVVTTAVAELPEDERRKLAAAGGPLEIITAVKLDERQQTECREALGPILGQVPSLVFRTDPALIAGAELRNAQMLIRSSWQADLEHIAAKLRQDEQHDAGSEHVV
jgi:F-type H+-transporting ATPase subunit b